jgi:hypothetical protein
MQFSSSNTNWIWGMKSGSSLDTDSQSAGISEHDHNGYGTVAFDSTAQGGTGANPFLAAGSTDGACSSAVTSATASSTAGSATTTSNSGFSSTDSSSPTITGEGPAQTGESGQIKRDLEAKSLLIARGLAARGLTAEAIVKRATTTCTTSGSSGTLGTSNSGTANSGTSSGVTTGSSSVSRSSLVTIHGILAGFIFTLLFPFGGIMIRILSFKSLLWAHGILQIIGYIGYIVAMGLGIYIATHPSFVSRLSHIYV